MIIIAQGAGSGPPAGFDPKGGFDPQANKPVFDAAWREILRAFRNSPMPNGNSQAGESLAGKLWFGWALDTSIVHGRGVRLEADLRLTTDNQDKPWLICFLDVSQGAEGAWHGATTVGKWEGPPEKAAELAEALGRKKQEFVDETKFFSRLLSPILDAPMGLYEGRLAEFSPGSHLVAQLSGKEQGVAWNLELAVKVEQPGTLLVTISSSPRDQSKYTISATGEPQSIGRQIKQEINSASSGQKVLIDELLPGALKVRSLISDVLRRAGLEPTETMESARVDEWGDVIVVSFLDRGQRIFTVTSGWTEDLGFSQAVMAWGHDRQSQERTQIVPPPPAKRIHPNGVTRGMVMEGLARMGIDVRFKPGAEDKQEAIDKVNNGDLLGAIQLMADLIDKKMQEPEFFQSYLAALQAANEGDRAMVAEFINSL